MTSPIVSVDELCAAVERVLRDHLTATMDALGYDDAIYDAIKTWQQLPTVQALSTAQLPGIAIASPGITAPPVFSRADNAWRTTWGLAIGVYERGKDHADTQARVRNWCAGIRTTVQMHKSLGGVTTALAWKSEAYNNAPATSQARTIAGGAVAFDVTALVPATVGTLPSVSSTPTTLSVQQPGGTP